LPGAASDDILDAVAAMWSARRAALGTAKKFGSGELDPLGRPMFIHV
jgi:predicted RNase H-like nuclease